MEGVGGGDGGIIFGLFQYGEQCCNGLIEQLCPGQIKFGSLWALHLVQCIVFSVETSSQKCRYLMKHPNAIHHHKIFELFSQTIFCTCCFCAFVFLFSFVFVFTLECHLQVLCSLSGHYWSWYCKCTTADSLSIHTKYKRNGGKKWNEKWNKESQHSSQAGEEDRQWVFWRHLPGHKYLHWGGRWRNHFNHSRILCWNNKK